MLDFDPTEFWRNFEALHGRGDVTGAADLLEDSCDSLFSFGLAERDLFAHCAAMIPPRLQSFYPRIMLGLAWRLIAQWRFTQVDDLHRAIRLRIEEMERSQLEQEETSRLRHVLRHREMIFSATQDDFAEAEAICRELIDRRYRTDSYVNGSLFSYLLHTRCEQFKLSDFDMLDAQASDYHRAGGSKSALIVHDTLAALSLFALGRTAEASQRLFDALEEARSIEPNSAALSAVSGLPLAEILFERASFEEADRIVADHLPHAQETGLVDHLISGYLTKSRLYCRAGEHAMAFDLLDRAKTFAAQRGFRRLSALVLAERCKILLQQGRLGHDREHTRSLSGLGVERLMPGPSTTTVEEAEALAWVLVAEAHCNIDDGLHLAQAWSKRLHREGAVRSRMRWQLVMLRLFLLAGERSKAIRLLHETLAVAAKGMFYSSFLQEPAIMDFLRANFAQRVEGLDPQAEAFGTELLALAKGQSAISVSSTFMHEGPASFSALSPREIEVLTLASSAWRNCDIADRLGLTETTVKWYFQQIYGKLGVRRRSLAVDRAKRFGLIHSGGNTPALSD
jgi:LuxR family maltose regulon positive regulatory protein